VGVSRWSIARSPFNVPGPIEFSVKNLSVKIAQLRSFANGELSERNAKGMHDVIEPKLHVTFDEAGRRLDEGLLVLVPNGGVSKDLLEIMGKRLSGK
jgi:hypothetical protein